MSGLLDKLGLGGRKDENEVAKEAGRAHTETHQKAASSAGPGQITTQTTTTTEKSGPTLRSGSTYQSGSSAASRTGSAGWQGATLTREQQIAEEARMRQRGSSRETSSERDLFTQRTGISGDDNAMTRSEEHLRVTKDQVASGKAELNKYVTVEHVEQQVPVTRERIVIEREPINASNWDRAMTGSDISEAHYETLLTEEHVHAEKEVVPIERIRLSKQVEATTESVGADLRREHIDLSVTKLPGEVIGHSQTTEILGAQTKSDIGNLQAKTDNSGFGAHLKTDAHTRAMTNEERIAQARKEETGF